MMAGPDLISVSADPSVTWDVAQKERIYGLLMVISVLMLFGLRSLLFRLKPRVPVTLRLL